MAKFTVRLSYILSVPTAWSTVFLIVALSAATQAQSQQCNQIETVTSGLNNTMLREANFFTETNCPSTSCLGECLTPEVHLPVGSIAYAECVVEMAETETITAVKIQYYSPERDECIEFVTETFRQWYHFDEHYHFRKSGNTVEILIANIRPEHNLTRIVCLTEDFLDPMHCTSASITTLLVTSEVSEMPTVTPPSMTTVMSSMAETSTITPTSMTTKPQGDCNCNDDRTTFVVIMAISLAINLILCALLIILCTAPMCILAAIEEVIMTIHRQ